ncbi:MAG: hypothetical protein H7X80_02555 [bacterium]|nr:hypothetical protein [Candidatus Kapabacteria bacterium]
MSESTGERMLIAPMTPRARRWFKWFLGTLLFHAAVFVLPPLRGNVFEHRIPDILLFGSGCAGWAFGAATIIAHISERRGRSTNLIVLIVASITPIVLLVLYGEGYGIIYWMYLVWAVLAATLVWGVVSAVRELPE